MKPCVLVVEDDASQRRILGTFLHMAGFDVYGAESAEAALVKVKEQPPDLVLTDHHLPGMGGTDLCRALRADSATAGLFIILATGDEDAAVKSEGLLAGADDFLRKPVRSEELVARVKMGVRVRTLTARIADLETRLQRAARPVSVEILERLLAQIARAEQIHALGNAEGFFEQVHRSALEARRAFEGG